MPLTSAQIISLAVQDARVPGMTAQAGQTLNAVLSDLCQTYDFAVAKKTYLFNFNASQINSGGQAFQNFPTDYLRGIRNETYYTISGVPYPLIPLDQEEYDMLVQQAGMANFPVFFTVDMSLTGSVNNGVPGTPVALFWMIPSGAYPATVRYFSQMPDITTPETSSTVPWFPNQTYLRRRLAGELMALTDDERMPSYLGDSDEMTPNGAGVILRKYLQMKDDKANRIQTVHLDRRRFGESFDRLRNTKLIGWVVLFAIATGDILFRNSWVGIDMLLRMTNLWS